MTDYRYTQKGRSVSTLLIAALAAVLATLLVLTKNPVLTMLAMFLLALALSGTYAFLRAESWSISVQDGVLSWSYDRWPRSHGTIDLKTARRIVVDDRSSTLLFTFEDGRRRKIKLIGSAGRFRDYVKAAFPTIDLVFIEGT